MTAQVSRESARFLAGSEAVVTLVDIKVSPLIIITPAKTGGLSRRDDLRGNTPSRSA